MNNHSEKKKIVFSGKEEQKGGKEKDDGRKE